ncbi:MAG: class I SAM-dependent methyltransferase [Candidatus Aminicenantales bacterium]
MEETNGSGKSGAGIRTRGIALCLLCEAPGVPYYERLVDKLYGVPGEWNWLRCPACGLFWLNPRPIPEDMEKLYEHYHTHAAEVPQTPPRAGPASLRRSGRKAILAVRFGYAPRNLTKTAAAMGWFLSSIPSFRERAGREVLWLRKKPRGRLLEIGCGNGEFLRCMQARGWDVVGIEPDPVANGTARRRFGLDVLRDPIEEAYLEAASFDAIAMNNVIEHLENPVRTLGECARLLRKGGELVIVTPNVESLGHRVFGRAWRGLEPPRHFFLFSMSTLKAAFRSMELKIDIARTTATGSQYIWRASRSLRRGTLPFEGRAKGERRLDKWESRLFSLLERALAAVGPFGEEIVLIAQKK